MSTAFGTGSKNYLIAFPCSQDCSLCAVHVAVAIPIIHSALNVTTAHTTYMATNNDHRAFKVFSFAFVVMITQWVYLTITFMILSIKRLTAVCRRIV